MALGKLLRLKERDFDYLLLQDIRNIIICFRKLAKTCYGVRVRTTG